MMINRFILEFLQWTLPSLNLVRTIVLNRDLSSKFEIELQTDVDPDETAQIEPSHQDSWGDGGGGGGAGLSQRNPEISGHSDTFC